MTARPKHASWWQYGNVKEELSNFLSYNLASLLILMRSFLVAGAGVQGE